MAPSGQLTALALGLLLRDGELGRTWDLDASRSQVRLNSKSMSGLAAINGAYTRLRGCGTVSHSGQATGTLTVDAGSVDTGNKKRDEHLRSADFFDAASHPAISFTGKVHMDAKVRINRADFGMTRNQMGMASMGNTITVFTQQ